MKQSAKRAGLRYGTDEGPGIHRELKRGRPIYTDSHGRRVRDARTLARIRSLVIPPAWTDVWISPHPDSHLQVTGRDAKGRKQYRYHPRWREQRDANKYSHVIAFAKALPKIRRRVKHDLRARGLTKPTVVAAIVRLLETSLIRVGNEEYARNNHSFGLTTMRDHHADVHGSTIRFRFRGKSGVNRDVELSSPRVAAIVRRCQDLPGQELFQYLDEAGEVHDIGSADVNDYLREVSGLDVTAKDFRTWVGTALAAQALQEFESFDSQARAKKNIVRAIERVASRLGNTPSVCKKCYIHPAVLEAYLDRSLVKVVQKRTESDLRSGLGSYSPEEAAVLALLQQRLKREAR
jgi:DNA topoisomerase I